MTPATHPPAGHASAQAPSVALRARGHRLLLALLLVLLIGNAVIVLSLKGRNSALQLVHRDTSGEVFEAPPDRAGRAHPAGFLFDYTMGMDSARGARAGAPAATRADGGLEDLRNDVRWVRSRLRTGAPYPFARWRLEDALAAAADPGRRFFCFSYACAMVSVAESQGYPARVVYLGDHITSEVYLPARRKWVLADATYDVIPHGAEGDPLSVVETHRRLVAGEPVEWRPVVGVPADDATLDEPTRRGVESMMRAGDFFIKDGALTFDHLGDRERLMDVLRQRPRVLQLALNGQPSMDRDERRLRTGLVMWNAFAALALGLWVTVQRRAPAA